MEMEFSRLNPVDLNAVDDLMKRHGQTLGFLPAEALRDYIAKGCVLGAKHESGQLMGYLLYGSSTDFFRVVQLCVSEEARGQGVARQLLQMLKDSAHTQTVIKLSCRRDFPAHRMWPRLGFVPVGERPGRSAAGHLLTLWSLSLEPAHQMGLGLFQAQTSDDTVDIIIDAQVFFDFSEQEGAKSEPSKALLSDFLIDSITIWTTDELFNEIDRNSDPEARRQGRSRAQRFPQVESSPRLFDDSYSRLQQILPVAKPSDESDIRQLARAASSNVKLFVTRDEPLLKKARDIANLTNLKVLSPTQLIIQIHELLQGHSYGPIRVSGLNLGWYRLTANDLTSFPFGDFLNEGERLGRFKEEFYRFLASPNNYECELLKSGDAIVAARITSSSLTAAVKMPLARVAPSSDKLLFGRFLISDTLAKAVTQNQDMVQLETTAVTPSLAPDLLEMGFTKCDDHFVRFCFSSCLDREDVLEAIAQLSPNSRKTYELMTDLALEQNCSPLSLTKDQEYFLIPIRPGYALSLIDRQQSSMDFFGGDPKVLLLWHNVYYRKATLQKMIKAPARLLWYVSGSQKQIVAVSTLDEVVNDTPKELLRRFKNIGVLRWEELYRMCEGDTSTTLMALKFSHTFPFRRRIPLDAIRTIYENERRGLNLQTISRMPGETFQKLFRLGFPNQ